jgi:hypothetical protein
MPGLGEGLAGKSRGEDIVVGNVSRDVRLRKGNDVAFDRGPSPSGPHAWTPIRPIDGGSALIDLTGHYADATGVSQHGVEPAYPRKEIHEGEGH